MQPNLIKKVIKFHSGDYLKGIDAGLDKH